jgi:hypothetical protein
MKPLRAKDRFGVFPQPVRGCETAPRPIKCVGPQTSPARWWRGHGADSNRRSRDASYLQCGRTPSTGPFTIPFAFFANADLLVYVGGVLKTLTTDYTVAGIAVDNGFSGGTITLVSAVSNTTVTIIRDVAIKRTTDFPTSGPLQIGALNTDLDKQVAISQQLEDAVNQRIRLPEDDPTGNLVLPSVAARKNKYFGFDDGGNPVGIQANSLGSGDLSDGAVTTPKIAADAVTADRLGSDVPEYIDDRGAVLITQGELGKDPGNMIKTIGDVLDALISAAYGDKAELDAIKAKRDAIKARFPRPA